MLNPLAVYVCLWLQLFLPAGNAIVGADANEDDGDDDDDADDADDIGGDEGASAASESLSASSSVCEL